ncbi:MAG: hypothetical protein B6I25_04080 [Planctomycetales bacterium 4572_13]|nr:MAG: hypothetical protein B6I25_04080 [Planctomycetales bacterium 4572_13]
MWEIQDIQPVKLIVGILACDERALEISRGVLLDAYGTTDLISEVWPFDMTEYYESEAGPNMVRQFMAFENLIDPGRLAAIKHETNRMEQDLATSLDTPYPRPINFDPGFIEPSKLVLASTKNFAHRIYIGDHMYAEVTLTYNKGRWETFPFTFPDYKSGRYNAYLSKMRQMLVQQLRERKK